MPNNTDSDGRIPEDDLKKLISEVCRDKTFFPPSEFPHRLAGNVVIPCPVVKLLLAARSSQSPHTS